MIETRNDTVTAEHMRAYGRRLRELIAGTSCEERALWLNELINFLVYESEEALDELLSSVAMGYGDKQPT